MSSILLLRGDTGSSMVVEDPVSFAALCARLIREWPDLGDVDQLLIVSASGVRIGRGGTSSGSMTSSVVLGGAMSLTASCLSVPLSDSGSREELYVFSRVNLLTQNPTEPLALAALTRFVDLKVSYFKRSVESFRTSVDGLVHRVKDTLSGLETSLSNLRDIKLHEGLVSENRSTLLDVVPADRLREFGISFHKQLFDFESRCLEWFVACEDIGGEPIGQVLENIRSHELAGVLLEEIFARIKKGLNQLSHISKLPNAYSKTLNEISRRSKFRKEYLAKIEAAKSTLKSIRIAEEDKRKAFNAKYGCHLPAGLFPNLDSTVPDPRIELLSDFDLNLPQIEADDLRASMNTPNEPFLQL